MKYYYYIGDHVYFEVNTFGTVLFQGFGTITSFFEYELDPQCSLKNVQYSYKSAEYELGTQMNGGLSMRMKYIK